MKLADVRNYQDALYWLKFLDRSLPVANWRADGVDFWPLARSILGTFLHNQIRVTGADSPINRPTPPHIAQLAALQANTRRHRAKPWRGLAATGGLLKATAAAMDLSLSEGDVRLLDANRLPESLFRPHRKGGRWLVGKRWLLVSNGNLDQQLGGKTVNRLFSPIARQASRWGVEVREIVSSVVPADYGTKRPNLYGMADGLWWLRRQSRNHPLEISMPGFEALMRNMEGSPLHDKLADGALETAARALTTYTRAFTELLQEEAVTAVFVVPYHSQVGMALCAAARANNIPAIDIQHGIIGRPNPHYEIDVDVEFNCVPTHLWLWSANGVETPRLGPGCRSFVGGNPAYALVHDARRANLEWEVETGSYAKEILVTLSRGLAPGMLAELIETSPATWRWWLRLHPSDYLAGVRSHPAIEPFLGMPNCEWKRANELPLPMLLEIADVHFTKSSSTVIEARLHGLPTVFYDRDGYEYYRYLRNSDRDVFAASSSEALKAIAALPTKRTSRADTVRAHARRVNRTARLTAILPWRWAERLLDFVGGGSNR